MKKRHRFKLTATGYLTNFAYGLYFLDYSWKIGKFPKYFNDFFPFQKDGGQWGGGLKENTAMIGEEPSRRINFKTALKIRTYFGISACGPRGSIFKGKKASLALGRGWFLRQ